MCGHLHEANEEEEEEEEDTLLPFCQSGARLVVCLLALFLDTMLFSAWGRIHVGRIGYPLATLPSRIRPLGQYYDSRVDYPPLITTNSRVLATRRITPTAPSVFRGRVLMAG